MKLGVGMGNRKARSDPCPPFEDEYKDKGPTIRTVEADIAVPGYGPLHTMS